MRAKGQQHPQLPQVHQGLSFQQSLGAARSELILGSNGVSLALSHHPTASALASTDQPLQHHQDPSVLPSEPPKTGLGTPLESQCPEGRAGTCCPTFPFLA